MASLNELLYEVRRIEKSRVTLTEKKMQSIYRSLYKDLSAFISDEYVKYADEDGRLFLSYLDGKNKRAKFLENVMKNVDGKSSQVRREMLDLVDATYEKAYKGIANAVKNADDTKKLLSSTDTLVRPEVLKQAVYNNIDKLTLDAVMEKHRAEIIADIQQTLTVGLMNGDRYETMAKRIQERLGVSYGKASNIARTESHRNIENGLLDGAKETSKIIDKDGDLIYAATWRTMKDERVRPQQRRRTKKGWVTTISGNGANHIKMEGVTIKVGEKFKLEPNVYAECPGMSGTARNDCRCRCFLEYRLMTVAEFAKATNQTEEAVRKKYKMSAAEVVEEEKKPAEKTPAKPAAPETVKLQLSDYPDAFTTGAEGKNTKKLIDYINGIEGADPNALKLYSCMGKLESVPFKISHAKGNAITYRKNRITGELSDVKITVPKFKGDNITGQVNTTLHEEMHLMDLFGAENGKWYSVQNQKLVDVFDNTPADIGDDLLALFKKHDEECVAIRQAAQKAYDEGSRALKDKYLQGMSPWENPSGYKQYEKEAKKLLKQINDDIDYNSRNIMGGGICNLEDIYDALSGGQYRAHGIVRYGHGTQYYSVKDRRVIETIANYASLSVTRPDLIAMLRKDKPDLCKALDELIKDFIKKAGG